MLLLLEAAPLKPWHMAQWPSYSYLPTSTLGAAGLFCCAFAVVTTPTATTPNAKTPTNFGVHFVLPSDVELIFKSTLRA